MQTTSSRAHVGARPAATAPPRPHTERAVVVPPVFVPWVRAQGINVRRHAAALRPFRADEFGVGAAAPSDAHIEVVNRLISTLRRGLLSMTNRAATAAQVSAGEPTTTRLQALVTAKDRAHTWVRGIEKIWDFYLELFGQRQSRFADWLLSCDRIALDCYQYAFLGVGRAKSVPAPPPMCYMRTGFSPATYRRGIPLSKLGRQLNPFPLIQLPYHRLVNPWTLGAILHEVSHNLQSDLGLGHAVPRRVASRLLRAGLPRSVAAIWARWNRETFADLSGILLGGPTITGSLLDILARSPAAVSAYNPRGPHPTPILRGPISFELVRRMGFPEESRRYELMWKRIYPDRSAGDLPPALLETFDEAAPLVVDAVCFEPYPDLGDRTLAQVLRFEPKEQQMIEEAARRLAAGNDPGVVPARFLIGAARIALDRRYARPGVITTNFYKELTRR